MSKFRERETRSRERETMKRESRRLSPTCVFPFADRRTAERMNKQRVINGVINAKEQRGNKQRKEGFLRRRGGKKKIGQNRKLCFVARYLYI